MAARGAKTNANKAHLPLTPRIRLSHMADKKSKKSSKYPHIFQGIIPAGITGVKPLGFQAELATDAKRE